MGLQQVVGQYTAVSTQQPGAIAWQYDYSQHAGKRSIQSLIVSSRWRLLYGATIVTDTGRKQENHIIQLWSRVIAVVSYTVVFSAVP